MISAVDHLQILKTHRTSGQQTAEILLTETTYHCLVVYVPVKLICQRTDFFISAVDCPLLMFIMLATDLAFLGGLEG